MSKKINIEENLMVDLTIEGSKSQIVDILNTLGIYNEVEERVFSMDNDLSDYEIELTINNFLDRLFWRIGGSSMTEVVFNMRGLTDILYGVSIHKTPSKTYRLTLGIFEKDLLSLGNLNQWGRVVKKFPKSKWTIHLYEYDKDSGKTVDLMERTIHHKVLKTGESQIIVE